jgi:hypothetical protein
MCVHIYEKRWFKYKRHKSISLNILFQTKTQTKYSDIHADNSPSRLTVKNSTEKTACSISSLTT